MKILYTLHSITIIKLIFSFWWLFHIRNLFSEEIKQQSNKAVGISVFLFLSDSRSKTMGRTSYHFSSSVLPLRIRSFPLSLCWASGVSKIMVSICLQLQNCSFIAVTIYPLHLCPHTYFFFPYNYFNLLTAAAMMQWWFPPKSYPEEKVLALQSSLLRFPH